MDCIENSNNRLSGLLFHFKMGLGPSMADNQRKVMSENMLNQQKQMFAMRMAGARDLVMWMGGKASNLVLRS